MVALKGPMICQMFFCRKPWMCLKEMLFKVIGKQVRPCRAWVRIEQSMKEKGFVS